jgi:hypothetical protein
MRLDKCGGTTPYCMSRTTALLLTISHLDRRAHSRYSRGAAIWQTIHVNDTLQATHTDPLEQKEEPPQSSFNNASNSSIGTGLLNR